VILGIVHYLIRRYQRKEGDNIARLTGVESVLDVGGLPLFEFMMPSVDRMVTSEYFSKRNMSSSSIEHGAYSVMTGGPGYMLPQRRDGIQQVFGGSGMSYYEYSKPIEKLLNEKDPNSGLNLIFKANSELIKKYNLEGIVNEGNDILVAADGRVLSPHLDLKNTTAGIHSLDFEKGMQKVYKDAIEIIKSDKSIESLGDGALFVNGSYGNVFSAEAQGVRIRDAHHTERELKSYAGRESIFEQNALYNKFKENDNLLFKSIHIAKVDMRTPKAGINDWVITRIEKLLDRRRGPVSEMNFLDVIDPQDADFDLDKSASFFALPGKVMSEMYAVSGYMAPAPELFDAMVKEVRMEHHRSMTEHAKELESLERKRPELIRNQSIVSMMLQYASSLAPKKDLFRPGKSANTENDKKEYIRLYEIPYKQAGEYAKKITVSLKTGHDFADSSVYLKGLIKSTIDIYKKKADIKDRNLSGELWTDPDKGFLSITVGEKEGTRLSYKDLPPESRESVDAFIDKFLKPIGDIYNLSLMTDNFRDGTKRPMSAYQMVHKYEQALADLYFAGVNNPEMRTLAKDLIGFLSYNKIKQGGRSELPIVRALRSLKDSSDKTFASTIPHDSDIADMVYGRAVTSGQISKTIASVIADQKKVAQITALNYKLQQIENIVSDLKFRRKTETSEYSYWNEQYEH